MHYSRARTFLVAALIATILPFNVFSTLVAQAVPTTVVVAPHNLEPSTDRLIAGGNNNWFLYNDESDTIDNTLGSFVVGPATTPAGSGSAQISVSGEQRRNLATYQFRDTPLASITTLKFSTYNPSAGNPGSVNRSGYLHFNVSFDGNDTWQKRLIYVPSANGTVLQNTWQEWDALNSGNALWSWSGGTSWPDGVNNTTGYVGANRTWADILADYPGAKIRASDSFLGIRVGEPYADGYTENIDVFKFGVNGSETVFDFEPETPCTTTCYVDAVNGNDAFGGDTIASAKKTIQAAIDQVNPVGEVRVLPGNYEETASNRLLFDNTGPYQFGLFVGAAKSGITIRGVTDLDVPIDDFGNVEAFVTTNATNNFGPSSIFVEGDNVTISGLNIGANSAGENKTVEIIGDNFTLLDSIVDVPGGGSVYLNDWRFDATNNISHVRSYRIEGNSLTQGTSIDIASGAGFSGDVSGRIIKENVFDGTGAYWALISFSGSGTGVSWFVYSVGGAKIQGNTFSGGTQYIRARGDYDNAQFDWAAYWNNNTFDKAVVVGPTPPAVLSEFSYTSGSYTFNHVRRIGATIQGEADNGVTGDTVLVAPGTYAEQVTVAKSLTLIGAGAANTTIQAPASLPAASTGESNIVKIAGAGVNVELSGFTVAGPGPGSCGTIGSGILVRDGANANIHDNHILNVRDQSFSGCQNGVGIQVGRDALGTIGTANIVDNTLDGYQKNGITVDGIGSSAHIEGNTVQGAGATTVTAQNGIQISRGATGDLVNNTINGHSYTPNTYAATGVLLYYSDANTSGNHINENQIGIFHIEGSGVHNANFFDASQAGTGVPDFSGIVVDAPPPGLTPSPFGDEMEVATADAVGIAAIGEQIVTISNSEFDGHGVGVGIGAYAGYGDLDINLTVANNFIRDFATGVELEQCSPGCTGTTFTNLAINNNSITGNDSGLSNTGAAAVDAQHNWWNSDTGPAPTGSGDLISGDVGNVDVDPWRCSGADFNASAAGFQPQVTESPNCGLANLDIEDVAKPMHGLDTFDVPVLLHSGSNALSAVSFAVKWSQSCVTYNGVADSLPDAEFEVHPQPNAAEQQVMILVNPIGNIPLTILPDDVLITLTFNATACDIPEGTVGSLPVDFIFLSSAQPPVVPSFGNNMGQPVSGTTDDGKVTLIFNSTPTDITLNDNQVLENQPVGTVVGNLCTADQGNNTCTDFTYTLVSSAACASSAGNGSFTINSNVLKTNAVLNREASSGYYHNICVRSTDGDGLSVDKGFTIEVLNVNEAPDAVNDSITPPLVAQGGIPLTINVLANDTDVDGDPLTVSGVTDGAHGAVTDNDTYVTYLAPASSHYSGPDTFSYTASDGPLSDSANVSLNVVANDARADCNADGQIDAADFPATVLEIFDTDDGIGWWLTYTGAFPGSPRGCDSNASENGPIGTAASVEAGDIICTVQIFFGNTNCTNPVAAAAVAEPATLSIASDLQGAAGETVAIPVTLATAGNHVAAATFVLTFDGDAASFDPTDSDADGVPDAVTLNVPAGVAKTVLFDAAANQIKVAVYGTSLPLPLLSDGVLATIDLQMTDEASSLTLTQTSLGNDAGQSVPVIVDGGTTPLVGGDGELFIPLLNTK